MILQPLWSLVVLNWSGFTKCTSFKHRGAQDCPQHLSWDLTSAEQRIHFSLLGHTLFPILTWTLGFPFPTQGHLLLHYFATITTKQRLFHTRKQLFQLTPRYSFLPGMTPPNKQPSAEPHSDMTEPHQMSRTCQVFCVGPMDPIPGLQHWWLVAI